MVPDGLLQPWRLPAAAVHLHLAVPLTAALCQTGTAAPFVRAALALGTAGAEILLHMETENYKICYICEESTVTLAIPLLLPDFTMAKMREDRCASADFHYFLSVLRWLLGRPLVNN